MSIPIMSTYESYEKEQNAAIDQLRKQSMECITCPTCESQWFTEITISRYQVNHNIILGQNIPQENNTVPFKVLKCIHCSNLLEPRILYSARDVASDHYNDLLDTLEGKKDKRKEKKEEIESNEILSEKL